MQRKLAEKQGGTACDHQFEKFFGRPFPVKIWVILPSSAASSTQPGERSFFVLTFAYESHLRTKAKQGVLRFRFLGLSFLPRPTPGSTVQKKEEEAQSFFVETRKRKRKSNQLSAAAADKDSQQTRDWIRQRLFSHKKKFSSSQRKNTVSSYYYLLLRTFWDAARKRKVDQRGKKKLIQTTELSSPPFPQQDCRVRKARRTRTD